MEDLFNQYLESLIPCLWDIIATSLGSILNADGSPVRDFINTEVSVLPYPFSCIGAAIDAFKKNFVQQMKALYGGSVTSVSFQF